MGGIFRPDNFVFGQSGAGNNWAKGHYTEGEYFGLGTQERRRLKDRISGWEGETVKLSEEK